jgi:hypothetical protein
MAETATEATRADRILVADEAWVALASLHKKYPARQSFSAREILEQVRQEHAFPELRPGVQVHIHQHNVANLEPNPARQRMFYRLGDDSLRLYRPGDPAHPLRKGKMAPKRSELPEKYHYLLDWYEQVYCKRESGTESAQDRDPILRMWGLGKEIWQGVDADEYVRSLREGWEAE